jgi:hypothetical protein
MPPNFVSPKYSIIEVELGGSVNITCQANGMPKPRVKWQEGLFSNFDFYKRFLFFCKKKKNFWDSNHKIIRGDPFVKIFFFLNL